ncbi:MAG: SDR family NAD(P)-dependent oxidoreductase [Polyangiales bacterium]
MSTTRRRTALVTGASAGIGKAFAHQLALLDYDLVLTARRGDRLADVRRELLAERDLRIEVITGDLADPKAPQALFDEIAARGIEIDVLVNNAGYGIATTYSETSWEQQAAFLQVMVTAVAHLTHLFLPGMVQRGWGRIINVASLAGLVYGAPGATLYAAAKSFLIKLTESLSLELAGTSVHATAVCPGFTFSEFHDVNGMRERVSKLPSAMWLDAESVARLGVDAAMRGRTLVVPGAVNAAIATTMKHLPTKLARGLVGRQARRFRPV